MRLVSEQEQGNAASGAALPATWRPLMTENLEFLLLDSEAVRYSGTTGQTVEVNVAAPAALGVPPKLPSKSFARRSRAMVWRSL